MRWAGTILCIFAGFGGWAVYNSSPAATPQRLYFSAAASTFPCRVASITDGDTFRCSEVDAAGRQIRVRVSGIDARERDGSCAPGHPCASATAESATAALSGLIAGQELQCQATNETYGRTAAFCRRSDGTDISCAMLASGTVARWGRYMEGHRC